MVVLVVAVVVVAAVVAAAAANDDNDDSKKLNRFLFRPSRSVSKSSCSSLGTSTPGQPTHWTTMSFCEARGRTDVDRGGQRWTEVDRCGQMWTDVDLYGMG